MSFVGDVQLQKKMKFLLFSICLYLEYSVEAGGMQPVAVLLTDYYGGKVVRLDVSESGVENHTISSSLDPYAIDFDPIERQIYWTNDNTKQILRTDFEGNSQNVVISLTAAMYPSGLAVDGRAMKLFFTDYGRHEIGMIKLSESVMQSRIIINNQPSTFGIVLDVYDRKLFWTTHNHIATADYDGSNIKKIVTSGLIWPRHVTFDKQNGLLYWCDFRQGTVESVSVDGTQRKQLVADRSKEFWDISLLDGTLYISALRQKSLWTLPVDGGNLTEITTSLPVYCHGMYVIGDGLLGRVDRRQNKLNY